MKLNCRLHWELRYVKHPFVLIGGISFLVIGLISIWIGGNPRPIFLLLVNAPNIFEQLLFFILGMVTYLLNGFLFGALFLAGNNRDQLIATRSALLIIISQLFFPASWCK